MLGSLHCLPHGGGFSEPPGLYRHRPAAEVIRQYLAEVVNLVIESEVFSILAHIDYPIRSWPTQAGPFDPSAFEEEFRQALRATAQSGRALEINTAIPLHSTVLRWWHDEGGQAITFGSDAHEPSAVARGFRDAADMAEAHGFARAGTRTTSGHVPTDLTGAAADPTTPAHLRNAREQTRSRCASVSTITRRRTRCLRGRASRHDPGAP